jgi:RHS repeat-associated protein
MSYDAENRVKSANGGAATYQYDGNGVRVRKVAGGTTTVYIFSGTKVIAEYVNGGLSREYIYAGSQLIATEEGGTRKYHHADHLSVRVTTDTSGNIVNQRGHYPFGETWYESGTAEKWKFTTYERDSETLNDYAVFRSYINRFGRFSSPDPLAGSISDPQSLNRYAYVFNDPANLSDPLGLEGGRPQTLCVIHGMSWPSIMCEWFMGKSDGPGGGGTEGQQGGGGGGPIDDILRKLREQLEKDTKCLEFLSRMGVNPLKVLDDLISQRLVGAAPILPSKNKKGEWSITNAQTPGVLSGQAISVNILGAFFGASLSGDFGGQDFRLTTNRGRLRGGTAPAQAFILLHELGHLTNALVPDAREQKKVDLNDKNIEKNCKDAIGAFSGKGG